MNAFCVAELETAVIRQSRYFSAIQRLTDPQPQPSSRISIPSSIPARSQVSRSIASSAAARSSTPSS